MAVPSRQIGWSTESNLLWQICNQIDRMTGVIGSTLSTFVPQSRTLTINGVTYDLSADRSWTVAGGISGTGAAGQVAYWNGTSSQTGSNNLFWDAANSRLGIGTATPSSALDVLVGGGATWLRMSQTSAYYYSFVLDNGTGSLSLISTYPSASTLGFNQSRGGNVQIGATTDAGFKLDVNGTARVSGQVTGDNFVPTSSTIPINGIYLPSANTLGFANNSTLNMTLNSSGFLGIGIDSNSAASRLHISGDFTQQTSLNTTAQFFIIARKSRGTVSVPLSVNVNDEAGGILFQGYDGTSWRSGACIRAVVESVSVGSLSSNLEFFAGNTSPNNATRVMRMVGSTQNVLIGTTTDSGYKLDVNGTARVGGSSASAQLYLKGGVGNGQYLYFDDGGSNLWTIVGASIFAIDSSSTRIFRANANAQVTINGSSVNATAQLQVDSTTRGFLPPRMTNAQRTAISSPAVGLMVYQTDSTEGTYEYISSGWRIINGGGGGGSVDELQVSLICQVFG